MGLTETLFGGGGPGLGRRDSLFFGQSSISSPSATTFLFHLLALHLLWVLTTSPNYSVMGGGGGTECMKRKYFEITVSYFGGLSINRTVKCDMYFQWTVADYCCYDKYDRFERNPFCCYSETYKLVLAVGFICLVLLASSFSIFFCWLYNLPHHILYLLTCGKFHLNDWMIRNKNGPYVDPTFYSGEPFWARGAEMQPYPLRPMPPKIFYPAPPPKLKYRWDMNSGEIPLFVIASRQFTRNPYSARPQDRSAAHATTHSITNSGGGFFSESRRNSLSSNNNSSGVSTVPTVDGNSASNQVAQSRQTSSAQGSISRRTSSALYPYRQPPSKEPPPFQVNIDETEAAQELFDALKMLDDRGDKTVSEWNAMETTNTQENASQDKNENTGSFQSDLVNAHGSESGIFTISDIARASSSGLPLGGVRPNTTGNGGLDQYGNYVSLTNRQFIKPNTEALNQQLSTLGLPVYNVPGVHSAGVQSLVTTIQNYHVVSSNLGNPMETILEDDSLDDDIDCGNCGIKLGNRKSDTIEEDDEDESVASSPSPRSPSPSLRYEKRKSSVSHPPPVTNYKRPPPLLRRASTLSSIGSSSTVESPVKTRQASAMDHVVGPTPTTKADVPFMPTIPGSLNSEMDATFIDTVVRRNSVI